MGSLVRRVSGLGGMLRMLAGIVVDALSRVFRPIAPSPESVAPRKVPPAPAKPGVLDKSAVEYIVGYGVMAPSGANVQPWRFGFQNGELTLRNERSLEFEMLDLEDMATWVSFGAVVENMTLAARAIGLEPALSLFPDPKDRDLVGRMRFTPRQPERDKLLDSVPQRVANRQVPKQRVTLDPAVARSLESIAEAAGARLQICEDPERLKQYEELLQACDRLCFVNPIVFREFTGTFRWTREEVEKKRDGLDVWTLEAPRPLLRALTVRANVESLKKAGALKIFDKPSQGRLTHSSALALLTVRGFNPRIVFEGGRVVERLWLTVTAAGLSFQPLTFLPYFLMRVDRASGEGF